MAQITRVRCLWQNWPGAPGYTNFYMGSTPSAADLVAVRNFWVAIGGLLPLSLTVTVPSSGDLVEDSNGAITGVWTSTSPGAPVAGSSAGAYSGASGAVVHWFTASIVAGRRLRGRTFLVPLAGAYDTAGSLGTAAQTTLSTGAAGLVSALAGQLRVWSRPTPFRAGVSAPVTSSSVPDLAAQLRSRRT
jgi:hypothetical protein